MKKPAIILILCLAASLFGPSCTELRKTSYHLVTDGDRARYQALSAPLPAGWNEQGFDDSTWYMGPLAIGVGALAATPVPGLCTEHTTLAVRIPFDLGPLAPQVTRLRMTTPVLGGGWVAWVNGREVARASLLAAEGSQRASEKDAAEQRNVDVPAGLLRPAGNVLALQANCSPDTSEMVAGVTLDAEFPDKPHGIVRGPYLQALGPDGATVVFDTAEKVPGSVVLEEATFTSPAAHHHEIRVRGLQPGMRYRYHVEAGEARSEELTLPTAPAAGEPVTLLVFGDTRSLGDEHRRVTRTMAAEQAAAAIHTGDLVADGARPEEWRTFFDIEYPLLGSTALYPALGNHDATSERGVDLYRRAFVLPRLSPHPERVYSFDLGDVHVAVLDSRLDPAEQAAWLAQDVEQARSGGAQRVFLVMHHSPYSAGRHGGSDAARLFIAPLARQLRVDALFAGHDHLYERGEADGLRYFISGGGGAPLSEFDPLSTTQRIEQKLHYLVVQVTAERVLVQAKDVAGEVFDQVEW